MLLITGMCARRMPPHCSTELLLRVCKSPFRVPQLYVYMQVSELHLEQQVVVRGATMTWGVLLIRDPILSWMIVVKYTARNKFLAFGDLNSNIDDSMVRKPIVLLLYYF